VLETDNAGSEQRWFASCARGLAPMLADELGALGARDVTAEEAGVHFTGPTAILYRACLWSRLASRVLLPLGEGPAGDAASLYATVLEIPWHRLLADGASIGVSFQGSNAEIRDTRFGAQRSKDAIVDALRGAGLPRPRVEPARPDLRVSVRLRGAAASVALDLAGESLHRRGYRKGAGAAPLKENLAAALLMRAGWPEMAARGGALIDPLCGSATLLIEGAFMAADRAPALERERFGFHGWRGHEESQWQAIRADARGRAERGLAGELPEIRGYDGDPRVIRHAEANIAAAKLGRVVRVSVKALREIRKPTHRPLPDGLLIANPPYGERLGDAKSLAPLYRSLGELMHDQFAGWQAAILSPEKSLGQATGLRSHRQYAFWNGRLPVSLLLFDLRDNRLADSVVAEEASAPGSRAPSTDGEQDASDSGAGDGGDGSAGATMFANRLRKNQRRLASWLRRSNEECYRLYDADMPEYALAVDRYGDWLHVAEYRAPASVAPEAAARRLQEAIAALPGATGVAADHVVVKQRQRQKGAAQYERQGEGGELLSVREGAVRLLVNLTDYLDTGLFLDHRALRRRIGAEARGRRFLNLFCYTGSATVHAAAGGARRCTSVDLSNTYLGWLRRNLAHNGLAESAHDIVRADCLRWLVEDKGEYDLVLLDPPSFSNSARMEDSFDVQRDHPALLEAAMARLAPDGCVYFSTNRRRFRLADTVAEQFDCREITGETLDPDFPRRPPPHRCWTLRHRGSNPA
jgi:23S rRNA (guanine2445-N2)-methyltransferase / 23S rRNA (guanine2069-N7)-methyltransferase